MIMEIQAPLPLAQLPRPLDAEGKTLFNSVYGLSASRKVKRYEIVAAVDGEAINLYDVQSSRLITSYSVPPQSSFPCAPCSIRLKTDAKSSPIRLTYCVLQRPEVQFQCFTEKDEGHGTSRVAISVFSLDGTQSPVISLETIPAHHTSGGIFSCDIVVVHQDGTIRRIAGDVSAQRWSLKVSDNSNVSAANLTVRAAYWMDKEQAKSSLLKNRPDLYSGRDGRGSGLLALTAKRSAASEKGTQEMIYGIWSVEEQDFSTNLSGGTGFGTASLILHTLPDTERWINNDGAQYSFNSVNGALSVAFTHGLITYDLSAYTPEVLSKLSYNTTPASYPMRLTQSLVVGSTSSAVTLHNTKYQSVQSTVDLGRTGSKRKSGKSGSTNQSPIRFIAYFAKIKRLVACRGYALIAFDITITDTRSNSKAFSGDSMLIDAIGRGVRSGSPKHLKSSKAKYENFGTLLRTNHRYEASWASQLQRLDELAKKNDIAAFDELMAKELCNSSDGELFDHGNLQLPCSPLYFAQAKIDYLISKIFEPFSEIAGGTGESAVFGHSLKIGLQTPRLIHWLVLAGKLTDRKVERALQHTKSSQAFVIRPGAVVLALTRDTVSYEIIIDYLNNASALPISDVLQTIKLLLGDVVANAARILPPRLLHDGDGDHIMSLSENTNPQDHGEGAESVQQLALSAKPPSDDTVAPSSSSAALLITLEALGSHPPQDITAALRSQLGHSEILSIVQVLRQQLFHSGHTSYLPTPPTSARSSPKPSSTYAGGASLNLESILKLLSSCLDAIGPIGFLAQSENDDFLEKLIPDLKSEISFAFEGLQESHHLQGLLREVLRYAYSAQMGKDDYVTECSSKRWLVEGQQKPGTIVTLYSEPKVNQGDVEGRGGLLPLSLRANNVISLTKARKGGGQLSKRSRRDVRKLQDRSVGNYSFERLLL